MSDTVVRPAGRVRRADWATLEHVDAAGRDTATEAALAGAEAALAAARTEAATLLAEARSDAEALRAAVRQQAAEEGLAAGQQAVQGVLAEARAVLAEAWTLRRQILADALPEVVELSLAIARRVLLRELRLSPEEVVGLARRLLESVPTGPVQLLSDPVDAAYLEGRRSEFGEDVEVLADAALRPGDLLVRTAAGTTDATLLGRIERVEAAAREVALHAG